MDKKHTIQRISNKKRGKPKVRFNFMIIVIICLLVFAICFVFYMINANVKGNALDDDDDENIPQPVTASDVQEGTDVQQQTEPVSEAPAVNQDIVYPLPQSEAKGKDYFEDCCLITDGTLLNMSKNTDLKDIIGNSQLGAANCNTMTVSSSYGNLKPYEIIKVKKPNKLYIMLGYDIGTSTPEDMISNYTTLVSNIHSFLPNTDIYIMQLPPVPATTPESSAMNNDIINSYNTKLLNMAKSLGVYCIDTNTALRGADGAISGEYWSEDDGWLTSKAYKAIADYILTHTA